nr:S41 family peptidase [Chitinophagaceae bacterium]
MFQKRLKFKHNKGINFSVPFISIFVLFFVGVNSVNGYAQPIQKAAKDAFVITRMAEKYHISPRSVNEQFSADFFNLLVTSLDRDKIFFTDQDLQKLLPYKQLLHKEIVTKSTVFLQALTNIYQQKLFLVDTLLTSIYAKPFNFNIDEKFTAFEDTSFAKNDAALKQKLQKKLKLLVLQELADVYSEKDIKQKIIDSIVVILRNRIGKIYKRYIQKELNGPGGIAQVVGDEYCKALALCYDPHTTYMSETDRENFESNLGRKNKVFGFGMEETDEGKVTISSLQPGSAAFKSGQINVGDKIIAIQWDDQKPIDVADASIEETAAILDASNHAKTTLTILKADGTKRTVDLYKEEELENDDDDLVKSFILKGAKKIGYIYLPSFYEDWEDKTRANGCANDIAKEIVKLKKDKIDGLILDIRYNGGGSVLEAVDLAGIFIDAGPIAQSKTRDPKPYTLKDLNRGTIYDGPMAVLINGYSASASELLAGTLQDYHRAVIIGSNSYGKATGQRVLPLDTTINLDSDLTKVNKSAYLKLTLSQIFRVNGSTAQFTGIVPDVYIPDITQATNNKEKDELFAIPPSTIPSN